MNLAPNGNTEEDWEAQLAEYALGVMEPGAASEFERRLNECRSHVALAQQYTQVIGMLGYAVSPTTPPDGHKERFAARLNATPQEVSTPGAPSASAGPILPQTRLQAVPPAQAQPLPAPVTASAQHRATDLQEYRERKRAPASLPLLATVAAALILALGVWGWSAQSDKDRALQAQVNAEQAATVIKSQFNEVESKRAAAQADKNAALQAQANAEQQAKELESRLKEAERRVAVANAGIPFVLQGQGPQPSAQAIAIANTETNEVSLVANGLQPLPADKTYELWWLPTEQGVNPLPAGTFDADASGKASHKAKAPEDVSKYAGVAVTVEPAGGVQVATGPIVLLGKYIAFIP